MTGYVGPLDTQTIENDFFRQVLFTGQHAQLVVMCLQPGEEIGREMHPDTDQFFRIEQGEARFDFGGEERQVVGSGDAVVGPAGRYHHVINASPAAMLKLYTLYSPPNHPAGTVHRTKGDAEAAEAVTRHPDPVAAPSVQAPGA